MQYVFLSHDVDWRKQGPPKEHILNRAERFEENVIRDIDFRNPYYNFPQYMEIEESFDVRSTFFFRTKYENGDVADYEDELKSLIKGGWEVGLHTDPNSINDIMKIKNEKQMLESLTKTKIIGNRVHYLGFNDALPQKLQELGFTYDSTVKNSKDQIVKEDFGFYRFEKLFEFPITLMDAYMFTYMKLNEDQVLPIVQKALNKSRQLNSDFNIMTIIWHDNVLQMKGGRMYKKILEFLYQQENVKICNGIELMNILKNF
jgi:peptidoglycan/xylan/chitin deacetylase (PgdA/CDA1 family)